MVIMQTTSIYSYLCNSVLPICLKPRSLLLGIFWLCYLLRGSNILQSDLPIISNRAVSTLHKFVLRPGSQKQSKASMGGQAFATQSPPLPTPRMPEDIYINVLDSTNTLLGEYYSKYRGRLQIPALGSLVKYVLARCLFST